MKEFTADHTAITSHWAVEALNGKKDPNPVKPYGAFIGLDVHKETVAIAVALPGRESPGYHGEIANTPKALRRWLERGRYATAAVAQLPALPVTPAPGY